ncbi:MAG: GTPase ObgE [bacterium]|nr:GTPase ObgE [bacterium]
MAFIDEVTIHAKAGKGGDGVVRWLHFKGKEKGGPAGGDGGRGGDVVLEGVSDLAALSRYRFEKHFEAGGGGAGENDNRHGKNGDALTLSVPVGTTACRVDTGTEYEIVTAGEHVVILRGGGGGRGNAHYKSSTNQNPFEHTDGAPGQAGDIRLSLKLIADAGLVGLPSAGKSSLLNALTRAKAKVGAYPFTTLEPNLGDFYGHILADIPGLIEGASKGKGLGTRFLKHIERTGIVLHLVSADRDDVLAAYKEVRGELTAFGHGLSDKPELVILSKTDLISASERLAKAALLANATGREVLTVSIEDPELLKAFSDKLSLALAI